MKDITVTCGICGTLYAISQSDMLSILSPCTFCEKWGGWIIKITDHDQNAFLSFEGRRFLDTNLLLHREGTST